MAWPLEGAAGTGVAAGLRPSLVEGREDEEKKDVTGGESLGGGEGGGSSGGWLDMAQTDSLRFWGKKQ